MKKVSSSSSKTKQSTKAKGKQVAREVAGLPNGHADPAYGRGEDDDNGTREEEDEDHDRDGTMASYRTANNDLDEDAIETSEDDDDDETASEAASGIDQRQVQRRSSGNDRSKRPRPVQEIFQSDSLAKVSLSIAGPQGSMQRANLILFSSSDQTARTVTKGINHVRR